MKKTLEVLLDNKKDYTRHLCEILTEPIYAEINSLYQETAKKSHHDKVLESFQDNLTQIPKWNADQVTALKDRIYIRMDCNYFQELVKTTFMVYLKLYMISSDINTPIKVKVPSMDIFIHRCLVTTARSIWKKPYLFYHKVRSLEKQQNLLQVEKIIQKSIIQTIQRSLPLQDIFDHASQQHVINSDIMNNDNIYSDNENDDSDNNTSEDESSESDTDKDDERCDEEEEDECEESEEDEESEKGEDDEESEGESSDNEYKLDYQQLSNVAITPNVIIPSINAGIHVPTMIETVVKSETEHNQESELELDTDTESESQQDYESESDESNTNLSDDSSLNLVRMNVADDLYSQEPDTHISNAQDNIKELVIHEKKKSHFHSLKSVVNSTYEDIATIEKQNPHGERVPSPSPHLDPKDIDTMQKSLFNREIKHITKPKSFHLKPKKIAGNAFF